MVELLEELATILSQELSGATSQFNTVLSILSVTVC